ncbi:MAG: hypothetical protein ACRD5F_09290, partial [Candidatus Acidiferrales bacterium]
MEIVDFYREGRSGLIDGRGNGAVDGLGHAFVFACGVESGFGVDEAGKHLLVMDFVAIGGANAVVKFEPRVGEAVDGKGLRGGHAALA